MRSALDVLADKVAYAIGREIAKKTLAQDRAYQRLDALAKVTAVHTLAERMVPELTAEALAAASCVLAHKHLFMADPEPPQTSEAANGQAA